MTLFNNNESNACKDVRALLSEYTDSTLAAGQAWEVEKHLTGCPACAAEAREIKATVLLLQAAPRFDTSDNFMASLHARLDTADPAGSRERSPWARIQAWLAGGTATGSANRVPALSLGLAMGALALILAVNRPAGPVRSAVPPMAAPDSVHVSVASSANSPFSDPAADNLEYRSDASGSKAAKSF